MLNLLKIKQKITLFWAETKSFFWEAFVPNKNNAFFPKALKTKYLFWYGASLLILKIAIISLALVMPATDFFSAITSERLIALINQERQARNLTALALNTSLNSVANLKVDDMLNNDYFDHTSPAGVAPWHWFQQIGYNYALAGENLAMGFTDTDAVFQAWMDSPTHRANILNPNFKEMGLAVKTGQIQDHQDTLAVLVFGKQQAAAPLNQIQNPVKTAPPAPTKTPERSAPIISAAPNVIALISPEPSATPQAEQIALESVLKEQLGPLANQEEAAPVALGYAPRVLGAFASKGDEIFKSLYLYFTLFLAIALLVNIFVKIRIQYWPTILATTGVILLSTALIFI